MGAARASASVTIAYVAGIAPRCVAYMRTHWDHAKGFVDADALEQARSAERQRWVAAQQAVGLDLVSPSYVETEDILRPLATLPGAQLGPLTRTFETNTFHRRPEFHAAVPVDGLRPWVETVGLDVPWVLTLPSPYDAVARSQVPDEEVALSIAVCLNDAARYALERGARLVRFQEPTAAYRAHQLDSARLEVLLATALRGVEARSVVHFTQGDVLGRHEILAAVASHAIGIDVAASSLPDEPVLAGKLLHAGVVRGESSLVERDGQASAAALADAAGATLHAVTNGWDLEHVPFEVAVAKLEALAAARTLEVAA